MTKLYIAIENGKICDAVTELINKGRLDISNEDYIEVKGDIGDFLIGDTYDTIKKVSLKDSPFRKPSKSSKSKLDLRIEVLEKQVKEIKLFLDI